MKTPLLMAEIQNFRIAYSREPDLLDEASRFVHHRMVPYHEEDGRSLGGWQCDGRVERDGFCACGADALIAGLKGRKRVTPSAPLTSWEERQAARRSQR